MYTSTCQWQLNDVDNIHWEKMDSFPYLSHEINWYVKYGRWIKYTCITLKVSDVTNIRVKTNEDKEKIKMIQQKDHYNIWEHKVYAKNQNRGSTRNINMTSQGF